MTQKFLATCAAAAVIAGGVAAGVTAVVSITPSTTAAIEPVVFGVPMPLDPAADVPSPDQISGVLYGLADPAVPFASKSYLVEGGIGRIEARTADAMLQNAILKGQLPLNFSVANITPVGPGAVSASVTAAGPSGVPATQTVTFVDQGGWKLSRSSASTVLSIFSA